MIKRFFPLAAMALAVSSAFAAPVEQTSDEAFYSTPTTIPANHGELLSYRTATLNLGDSALTSATVNAWNVKYATQADPEQDVEQVATGTVYVPKAGVKGVIGHTLTKKTGQLAGAFVGSKDQDMFVISSSGIVIRVAAGDIRRVGRASQGVRTMRVEEGATVVALAPVISQVLDEV